VNPVVHLASTNPGKLSELADLLGSALDLRLPSALVAPEETGQTFAENALLKARALSVRLPGAALADDSGLEVDALGGRPGVHSSRYAASDEARIARLLEELGPAPGRAARFRCAIALVFPDGREIVVEGRCEGEIAFAPRGRHGFGYDPVFVPTGEQRTFAEMSSAEKAVRSHRAEAARQLLEEMARQGDEGLK
jgi:XTP/dITP diphosphohydrolase